MCNAFTKEEWEVLTKYRLTSERASTISKLSITLSDLLSNQYLSTYMHEVSLHIGSPNVKVTASMITKRLSFLVAAHLYAMTAFNKYVEFGLEDITLQTDDNDPLWLPTFFIRQGRLIEPESDRSQWRNEAVASLFKKISLLIEKIKSETRQTELVLWENIAIYIFWLYESVLAENDCANVRMRAALDLRFIAQEAKGDLFGDYEGNPIQAHYHEKEYIPHLDEVVRVRTTCCYFYCLTGTKDRCKICPQTCYKDKPSSRSGGSINGKHVTRAIRRTPNQVH